MKRFSAFVVAVLALAVAVDAYGAIAVEQDYVNASKTLAIYNYVVCDAPYEYRVAWTQSTECDRPRTTVDAAEGLTYTHLKIITGDNDCILFNGRIDQVVVGQRDLDINLPIGVPLTSDNITFGPSSDYSAIVIYWQKDGFMLYRDSTYRIEITEQLRECGGMNRTVERVMEYAVVTIPETCCKGKTGDIDGNGPVDIRDINYLCDYLYRGGPEPPCTAEADVDGDGEVDDDDVYYMIAYFYQGGPEPVMCL